MWSPRPEQAARLAVLWRHLSPAIASIWHDSVADERDQRIWQLQNRAMWAPEFAHQRDETVRQVAARVPAADPAWADFLCFPAVTELELLEKFERRPESDYRALASKLSWHVVRSTPTPYALELVVERLRHMLRHVYDQAEIAFSKAPRSEVRYFYPDVSECLTLLAAWCERDVTGPDVMDPDVMSAVSQAEAIVDGGFDVAIRTAVFPPPGGWTSGKNQIQTSRRSYEIHKLAIAGFCGSVLPALHRGGRLSYERFCAIVEQYPAAFPYRYLQTPSPWFPSAPISTSDELAVRDFAARLLWTTLETLDDRAIGRLGDWSVRSLVGGRWLVKACEHIERHGLAIVRASQLRGIEGICGDLARIGAVPADERAATVDALRRMQPATLLMVLPLASSGQPCVLEALGWPGAQALVDLIQQLGDRAELEAGEDRDHEHDVANSANAISGVIDRREIMRAIEGAGERQARAIIKAFLKCTDEYLNTLTLIQAAAGWNDAAIRKDVERDAQIPLKAYGLLPITRGDEEVRERYLLLGEAESKAAKLNPERSGKARAAAHVGLLNLAFNAGYRNLFQFECRMEAAGASTGAGTDHDPRTPPTRVVRSLERAMVDEDRFSREDLALLATLPAGLAMVTSLVWRTTGGYGLYDADAQVLRDLAGTALSLDDGVMLAHPWHLFRDDALEAWQRAVADRRIEQPFEQVLRKLYVPTPAELEARVESRRFASRVLQSRAAARRFQARAWTITPPEEGWPLKIFRAAALHVEFGLEDVGLVGMGNEPATTAAIVFKRGVGRPTYDPLRPREDPRIPLAEVPPVIFSEVMRDADAVVSASPYRY